MGQEQESVEERRVMSKDDALEPEALRGLSEAEKIALLREALRQHREDKVQIDYDAAKGFIFLLFALVTLIVLLQRIRHRRETNRVHSTAETKALN